MSTFDETAAKQGWNADSREQILRDFIATGGTDLDDYALKRAFEENDTEEARFSMDVEGQEYGGAYYSSAEYRVRMAQEFSAELPVVLWVEDSSGTRIDQMWLSPELIEGIQRMSSTDHSLSGYEDDWEIPTGMDRVLTWTLTTKGNHRVEIDSSQIDEIAEWLTEATKEN